MIQKNYLMKVFIAFSLSMLLTFLMMKTAIATDSADKDDPYRVESFTLNNAGALTVKTSGGFITVEGSSGNTVRVEMYVSKDGQELGPEDTDLDEWNIDISQSGNSVDVVAEKKDIGNWSLWGNKSYSVSFVIYVPNEMSSDLNTNGGHIEVRNILGNQKLSTSGGHIELVNLEGTVEARTSGGHIDIKDVQGDLEARTSGGHISAQNVDGNLQVKTSGGNINLNDVNGTVKASTSGGSIKADLKSIGQFVELRTSGGNVNVTVPYNIGLDLDLKGSYVSTNLSNFSGEIERNEVEGKINGGGPRVSARTSGGTVSLSFQ